jgi:hypothetical protein
MATMDIIKLAGAEPANFLDVGGGASAEMVENGFRIILSDRNVKGILINIFGGILRCDTLARGVVEAAAKTGIKVNAVYDVEAAKTTGLVNRLIAEASNPQADVFWNGEFAQTILLKEKGILAPYESPSAADIPSQFRDRDNCWTGEGAGRSIRAVASDE